jgi:sec-independent protein translocase protein TatB
VFDINGGELLILLAVALVVIGPERLPKYAAELARVVRDVRSFARNAREQVRSEMGEEFDDIDWQALDPRRYDPRRIVREALLDDDDEPQVSDRAPNVPAAMRPDDEEPGSAVGAEPDAGTDAGVDGTADGTVDAEVNGSPRTGSTAYDGEVPPAPRSGSSAYDADAT